MPRTQGQLDRDVLGRVLAVARHLGGSADLAEILRVIIDAMRDTLEAERATVFEYDQRADELFTTVAHGVKDEAESREGAGARIDPREIRFPASAGLAGECARTRRIINVPDAYAPTPTRVSIRRSTARPGSARARS
jgi:GAF domain-containing protein